LDEELLFCFFLCDEELLFFLLFFCFFGDDPLSTRARNATDHLINTISCADAHEIRVR